MDLICIAYLPVGTACETHQLYAIFVSGLVRQRFDRRALKSRSAELRSSKVGPKAAWRRRQAISGMEMVDQPGTHFRRLARSSNQNSYSEYRCLPLKIFRRCAVACGATFKSSVARLGADRAVPGGRGWHASCDLLKGRPILGAQGGASIGKSLYASHVTRSGHMKHGAMRERIVKDVRAVLARS
jgi:hypothetical protein